MFSQSCKKQKKCHIPRLDLAHLFLTTSTNLENTRVWGKRTCFLTYIHTASFCFFKGLIRPLKGLIRHFKGLIRPFKGLIRPLKGLIRPFKGLIRPLKGRIRHFKGLIRPFKGLIRPLN